jgi:hypothetical protein
MSYVIRYFRDGEEQGCTPPGDLETMKQIAVDGMVRQGMDCAVITDSTGTSVWAGVNDRAGPGHHGTALAALAAFVQRLLGCGRLAR